MSEITILVTSAGRRCELIELLRADARTLGLHPRIVATDLNPAWSSACSIADMAVKVPRADSPDYAAALLAIIRAEGVRLLVPTIDTELRAIAAHRDEWERAVPGLFVVSHGPDFVDLCRDKARTMTVLAQAGIDVPRTYFHPGGAAQDVSAAQWPLIGKPIDGSSSIGVRDIASRAEFETAVLGNRLMIQEKVVGAEFTVNIYVTKRSRVAAIVPHRRIAIRGGEVEKGIVEPLEGIVEIVDALVASQPSIRGPLNLQGMRRADGRFAVFEINGRFGGGFPLAHRAGGCFTRWAIEEGVLGRDVGEHATDFGWRMMRCDRSIFVKDGA